ncbi:MULTISPECIES: DUF1836 domain-containing protein [Clostridium]|uniref:DUF1836 domain-containing protein n=1 Tax=Clostridium senegalense TaxID=1465809 RepID=A0A6M0GZF3_9CLOT|nr:MULTISPECIES: DUF1836 domain-containing protein [Clostridium]MBU5227549.1 DUF1836 domain-containing protein [Clostridium senegalense]NEU03976.1 DUF1836 domain-containing protein [Clostridium senegalense]
MEYDNKRIGESIVKDVLDKISKLSEEVSEKSIISYEDLPQYDLFLSQVKDYLNDQFDDDNFTNNILQNYIKSEVISKPEDGKKRGYTKLHLIQLVLLSYMRPILTTEEIRSVFRLAFNEINDREDDILSWEETYKVFSDMQKNSFSNLLINDRFGDKGQLISYFKDKEFKEDEYERIIIFLIVMTLVAEASTIKKLIRKIVNEYTE